MKVKIFISLILLVISFINSFAHEDAFKMLLTGSSATSGILLVRNYYSIYLAIIFVIILFIKFSKKNIIGTIILILWLFSLCTKAVDNSNNKVYYGIVFMSVYETNTGTVGR